MSLITLVLLVGVTELSTACTRVMEDSYGWKVVRKKHPVNINFDTHQIEVKTDSSLGSFQKLRMGFEDEMGREAGGIFVKFGHNPTYKIGWCSHWQQFPAPLPTETAKIWRFSKLNHNVVVSCNNVVVINSTVSDDSCDKWVNWKFYWDRKTVRVRFNKQLDRASDQYRIKLPSSNWAEVPRGVRFPLDLQRIPLEVSTESEFGSNNVISISFTGEYSAMGAGGIKIKFSGKPRYSLIKCSSMTDFPWRSLKKLRQMPIEKVWTFERTQNGIRILVNGEEILDANLSDKLCRRWKSWKNYWLITVKYIKFDSDTASQSCRVQKPDDPIVTTAKPKRVTWSPPKGPNWYGTRPPPTEEPTKHSPSSRENCWMKGVRLRSGTQIASTDWVSEEECESFCLKTAGCHAAFKAWSWQEKKCEVYGVYDLYQPNALYDYGKGRELLAERKCFDPDFYQQENSTSPCGKSSWECNDRCIEMEWRCDGERDCELEEDEENCPSFNSPFCPEGYWHCYEHQNCPPYIHPSEERYCNRCIREEYLCNKYNNCYFGEDEREENCPDS